MIEQLTPTAPFDFRKMLSRPLSRPSRLTVVDAETASYTRAIRLSARPVPVTVTDAGTIEDPRLDLTYPEDTSAEERMEIRACVGRMFSTQTPLQDFYSTLARVPEWSELSGRLYGLRPVQDADLFESMVKVIIGQQLNVQFAATLVERLVDFGDEVIEWKGHVLPVFPSASQVASWSYDDLRALSFSQRKAEYVIDFARAVTDGRCVLDHFHDLPDDEIYNQLIPLRGIGRWTVECFLLFGLGRPNVMPAADIGVQNALQKLYKMEQRPREEEVRELAEDWAPWRSYATYYLWQSLIHPEQDKSHA